MINGTIDSCVTLQTRIYHFNTRLNSSDNIIVATIVNALYFRFTLIYKHWANILIICDIYYRVLL